MSFRRPLTRQTVPMIALTLAWLALGPRAAWADPEVASVAVADDPTPTGLPVNATPTQPVEADEPATIRAVVLGRASVGQVGSFPIEAARTPSAKGLSVEIRLRFRIEAATPQGPWKALSRLTADVVDGVVWGPGTPWGDRMPGDRVQGPTLQESWVGLEHGKALGARAGAMTSHWGLGLVANDGGADLEAGRQEWFALQRSGDRVMRAAVYGMPFVGQDNPLRGLHFSAAVDRVLEDDSADLREGQQATQGVLAARLFLGEKRWVGLYGVYRDQLHDDGKQLQVTVLDVACDFDERAKDGAGIRIQGEFAAIQGSTTLSPTPEFPQHDVAQLAALVRGTWAGALPGLTAQLDAGFFSGDENLDDSKLTAFRADRNLRQGFVLFEQVLATQTGRARRNASDPELVGYPAEDMDRLASDGAVFDAVTVFPKVGYKPLSWLEIYAGALAAWAPSRLVDPYLTRTQGGGYPRNFLGAKADGNLLGIELDLGVRATWAVPRMTDQVVQLALEAGHLQPGDALRGSDDQPDTVQAARLTLGLLTR
ncbi:MAG: hypothetical protein ACOYOB_09355 [Myxococcota bacterium]